MNDKSIAWIVAQITSCLFSSEAQSLWCLDENYGGKLPSLNQPNKVGIITNRWDVAQAALEKKYQTEFSDFDLSAIEDNSLDHIFYRISKEKAVVHHVLNEAWRCLKFGGKLHLSGNKNEGIKTYADKISTLLGSDNTGKKDGAAYHSIVEKNLSFDALRQLDDNNYLHLRLIPHNFLKIYTKPGLFGWNKVDHGSELLIEHLAEILLQRPSPPVNALDLGCGYGYLSLAAAHLEASRSITQWVLTDNNAAAILTARYNAELNLSGAEVIPADCANSLGNEFDLILCNPPFHLGFGIETELIDRFLLTTKRLLSGSGIAVFVVNQFIPIERKAQGLFHCVTKHSDNGSFKIISLEN